jgi:predicted SnoaL-like aldol condensation-catalyzing enzyme
MNESSEEINKRLVLKAFDLLFNQRDFSAAEQLWSPHYIQHSAHIPPGREGLFDLVKSRTASRYENQLAAANGDYVMLHGRFSQRGQGQPNWVVVDIVRLEKGLLAEHWDVIQEEATRDKSKSGFPMFGDKFPDG